MEREETGAPSAPVEESNQEPKVRESAEEYWSRKRKEQKERRKERKRIKKENGEVHGSLKKPLSQ